MLMVESVVAFLSVISAILFAVFMLFLPAIWEFTRPEDAGPRLIKDVLEDETSSSSST